MVNPFFWISTFFKKIGNTFLNIVIFLMKKNRKICRQKKKEKSGKQAEKFITEEKNHADNILKIFCFLRMS